MIKRYTLRWRRAYEPDMHYTAAGWVKMQPGEPVPLLTHAEMIKGLQWFNEHYNEDGGDKIAVESWWVIGDAAGMAIGVIVTAAITLLSILAIQKAGEPKFSNQGPQIMREIPQTNHP